jgi:acyl-[acyl carrier protein]--UDP-N-acetylglucosamine O-acyltransferase
VTNVHPDARISPQAELGENVSIGPFSIVHANVVVGPGTEVGSHCELGLESPNTDGPLVIGSNSLIRSHSVFYAGSKFGAGLSTGHRVTVREATVAGDGLQIGTLSDFQGHIKFGQYVRTHSNVHIGQGSTVGNFVWIFPYVVFTNDPHPPSDGYFRGVVVEDFAVVSTASTVLPGVRVGRDSLVGANSLVSRDVPPGHVVVGVPAKDRGLASNVQLSDGSGPAYPWRRHFHRGYPADEVEKWNAEN